MSIFCPVAKQIINSCNNVSVASTNPLQGTQSAPCAWYTTISIPTINDNGKITENKTISGCAMFILGNTLPLEAMYTTREILTEDE